MQRIYGIKGRVCICSKKLFLNVSQELSKIRLVVAMGFYGYSTFQLQVEYERSNCFIHMKDRIAPSMIGNRKWLVLECLAVFFVCLESAYQAVETSQNWC